MDRVLAEQPSELERAVLADHVITDAELHEAQQAFRDCVTTTGFGIDATFGPDGSVDLGPLDALIDAHGGEQQGLDAARELQARCELGTTANIAALYFDVRRNPQELTYAEAVRECFGAYDVPDGADLSAREFEEMLFAEPDAGYAASTPDGQACVDDPFARTERK
ncbi:hypothetical protein [Cellulomonas hominis]